MKKLILSFVLLFLVATLVACGGTEDETESLDGTNRQEESTNNNNGTEETNNDNGTEETNNNDENTSEDGDEETGDSEQEVRMRFTVQISNQDTGETIIEFSDPTVYLSQGLIIPVGGSLTYNVTVNVEGGILMLNEYTLIVVPGSDSPSFSTVASISIDQGTITFTGLNRGAGFFRFQLYIDGTLLETTNDIDLMVD